MPLHRIPGAVHLWSRDPGLALHFDHQAHERGTGPGDDDLLGLYARETTISGAEAGNDTLGGGDGRDLLSGGTGSDSLYGGDWLVGSAEGGTLVRTGRTSSSSRAASTPAQVGEHLDVALPEGGDLYLAWTTLGALDLLA